MSNIDAVASDLFATISAFIDKRVSAAVEKMLAEMQPRLDAIADTDTKRHEAALEEICTTDATVAELGKAVAELKALPPPKDGERGTDGLNGKDAEPVDVDAIVKTVVAAIPMPTNGKDGVDGAAGKDGKDGTDGASMSESEARAMMESLVAKAVAMIPAPKDGEDGRDGRDAIQCDVLDVIDPERRYQRGTFAHYKGGRIRAFRATDPMGDGPLEKFGWTVDLDGIADVDMQQGDDLRTFAFGFQTTAGKSFLKTFVLPVILDRGVFTRDKSYAAGDAVSDDGSMWIAQENIESAGERPAPPLWRLAVKRGRDQGNGQHPPSKVNHEPLRLR